MAIALPDLSIDRIRRLERARAPRAAPDERPLAVVERVGAALRLLAVDARAAAGGCAPGMPLAEARAVCSGLRVAPVDAHEDARLLASVADWCDRYTPLVALDPPRGLLLDVSGCGALFGGEAPLAEDVAGALKARGFSCRVAVADGAGPARALAWFTEGGVAPAGRSAALVARLPIAALGLADAQRTALLRAGLKSVGAVAARGRAELAARFGGAMVAALERALGHDDPPLSPLRPPPRLVVERRFPEPILAVEAALATLGALADALCRRLEAAGLGALSAEAAFFRSDGRVERVALGVGAPTRDARLLSRLFRERLDALADPLDPGFGYDLVRLSALDAERLEQGIASFDAGEQAAAELAELVDRLAARHGRARVLAVSAGDSHRPEAEARFSPAQCAGFSDRAAAFERDEGPPRRPLRLFATPEPIEVLAEVPDGPPVRFVWRRATHVVLRAEGPERIALEWWRPGGAKPTRDYFRVEDEAGARFWLYRDGLFAREVEHPRWFLHGIFA